MQQATGIVAEYNPFHNGHLYHLNQAKNNHLPVIAVMSGSIMQRGEFAFIDKWTRARLAVENGAALVLELPAAFSLRSAEFFARGAVDIMKATGCVKYLTCGTENPEYDFIKLAAAAKNPVFIADVRHKMRQGVPYAAAYSASLQELSAQNSSLNTPNDILALEYAKALYKTNIQPVFIKRILAGYNDTVINGNIASATAIRAAFAENNLSAIKDSVPSNTWQAIKNNAGYNAALLWQLISYRLRTLSADEIAACSQCSEGIENLLKQAVGCSGMAAALQHCSNKRYTASRIRRLFLQLLFNKPRNYFEQTSPAYLRVLAFNNAGRNLLKVIKNNASLPLITKLGKNPAANQSEAFKQQIELDILAADLLALLQKKQPSVGSDFLTSPYYLNL